MIHQEYITHRKFLEAPRDDSIDRGDYFLEAAAKELIQRLDKKWRNDDERTS
jgi:hypothetical protein